MRPLVRFVGCSLLLFGLASCAARRTEPTPEIVPVRDERSWSALHQAAVSGQRDVVAQLIAAGADPDARSREGFTPLVAAARAGRESVMLLLIEFGADVTARDPLNGYTPLTWSAAHGLAVAVGALAARESEVAAASPSSWDWAAAHAASIEGQAPMAVYEASSTSLAPRGSAALALGSQPLPQSSSDVLVPYTEATNPPPPRDSPAPPDLPSPLARAAAVGDTESLRLLLETGADPNGVEADGSTALMLAAEAGQLAAIDLLLAAGASVDARDDSGGTALTRAGDRRVRERLSAALAAR